MFIYLFFHLFILGCAGSSLLQEDFLQLTQAGVYSLVAICRLLIAVASRCRAQALGHRLSSCGTQAYLLCSMWDLPGPHMVGTLVPCIGRQILYHWVTREVPRVGSYVCIE